MQLIVQGKQIDVGEALRNHVTGKLEDINSKYFNHATDATVTFSKEGHGHGLTRAHISIRVGKNIMIMGEAVEGEPYASFDSAAEKVAKQMRRYKKRLRDHHDRMERAADAEGVAARDYVLAAEPETDDDTLPQGDDPVIIAEMTTNIQTMSVSEAVMRMDLAGQTALLFRNAKNNELNMVYRRPDGNVGWIDPTINERFQQPRQQAAE